MREDVARVAQLPDRAAAAPLLDLAVVVGLDVDHELGRAGAERREDERLHLLPARRHDARPLEQRQLVEGQVDISDRARARAGDAGAAALGHAVIGEDRAARGPDRRRAGVGQRLPADAKERARDVDALSLGGERHPDRRADRRQAERRRAGARLRLQPPRDARGVLSRHVLREGHGHRPEAAGEQRVRSEDRVSERVAGPGRTGSARTTPRAAAAAWRCAPRC